MIEVPRSFGNLIWKKLLSPEEICSWVVNGKKPERLDSELNRPGIYRFIFQEKVNENDILKSCYVGEANSFSKRLPFYFARSKSTDKWIIDKDAPPPRNWKARESRRVRDRIQNLRGEFDLQTLELNGDVVFGGLKLELDSIEGYDSSFVRRMLENWAILYSKDVCRFEILNHEESIMRTKMRVSLKRSN